MSRCLLDTDVASAMIKDRVPSDLFRSLAGRSLGLTYVTVGELTKWTVARNWGAPRRSELATWIARFPVTAADAGVAERWGELVAHADARGRPRPVNDSWIAACCLTYGLPLATLNAADFADFAEFEGLELL